MSGVAWLGAVLACLLAWPACTSPQLDTGPNHPASAEAAVAPLTPVGGALSKNFEPQAAAAPPGAEPGSAGHQHGAAPASAGHQHGAVASPPAAAAPAPAVKAEHGHEPAAEKKVPPAATEWTCPMHPEIIRKEPGNCPICGMKLKPVPPKDGVEGPR